MAHSLLHRHSTQDCASARTTVHRHIQRCPYQQHSLRLVHNHQRSYGAFWCCRIYRVYDFQLRNNVRVTSQLVFTSRELVKKKAARVGEWLATFTLFPLSPVQQAGDNGTEKLLIALDRLSCTNNMWQITLYLLNMTQQWPVAWLLRVTDNGCFDTANAIKSCVRVHGGQSSEFPIYPTSLERGIRQGCVAAPDLFNCIIDYLMENVSAMVPGII